MDEDEGFDSAYVAELEASESQPLQSISTDHSDEDIEDFVKTHLLEDSRYDIALFKKASQLLQGADIEGLDLTPKEKFALRRESTHKWSQSGSLFMVIGLCSLGAIEQGWAQTGTIMMGKSLACARHRLTPLTFSM